MNARTCKSFSNKAKIYNLELQILRIFINLVQINIIYERLIKFSVLCRF